MARAGLVFLPATPGEMVEIEAGPARLAAVEARAVELVRRLAEIEQAAENGEEWMQIGWPACERPGAIHFEVPRDAVCRPVTAGGRWLVARS